LRERATGLAAVTAVAAVVATLAVTATAELNPAYLLWVAVIGLLIVTVLALAATQLQHRNAQAALEVEAKNERLAASREETETANHARARFIADIAHDLRQPLHALGLFLDALERRVTPGEGEKILARTREASIVLSRAFNALIDLTRVEADTLVPEVEAFAIDDLLNRLEEESAPVLTDAGLDLLVVHSRATVVSDERLVGHMLRTFLANAMESGPSRLLLGARHRADRVWIELHCSSPNKHLAKWEVLSATEPARASSRTADELDLLVVRRLADLMGVSLRVTRKPDRGVVVAIGLPKAIKEAEPTLRNRAILLVVDDPASRLAKASALAGAGAVVHVACNVRQADHAARSTRFELLVTDLTVEDEAARDTRARLAATIPALPDTPPLEKLVLAVDAMLKR
jgi:hypothetical protein